MTRDEQRLLEAAKELDDIFLGMLAGPADIPEAVHARCVEKGWLRSEPRDDCWGQTYCLRTKGLRALRKVQEDPNP